MDVHRGGTGCPHILRNSECVRSKQQLHVFVHIVLFSQLCKWGRSRRSMERMGLWCALFQAISLHRATVQNKKQHLWPRALLLASGTSGQLLNNKNSYIHLRLVSRYHLSFYKVLFNNPHDTVKWIRQVFSLRYRQGSGDQKLNDLLQTSAQPAPRGRGPSGLEVGCTGATLVTVFSSTLRSRFMLTSLMSNFLRVATKVNLSFEMLFVNLNHLNRNLGIKLGSAQSSGS